MAYLSHDEYLKMQKERAERSSNQSQPRSQRVSYFSLKDDGDEAIVRFAYSDPSQLEVFTTHNVTIDNRFRRVNCLRSFGEPVAKCPLCESGQNPQQRTYIKLIEYSRAEDGSIVATPKIWERPASYLQILGNLFTEYGNISECVFKIRRSGERGSLQTTYSILFGNPSIYNSDLYPRDFSAFDNYSVVGGPLMDKTFEEMKELVQDSGEVEHTTIGTTQPTNTHQPQASVYGYNPQSTTTVNNTNGPRRVIY